MMAEQLRLLAALPKDPHCDLQRSVTSRDPASLSVLHRNYIYTAHRPPCRQNIHIHKITIKIVFKKEFVEFINSQ